MYVGMWVAGKEDGVGTKQWTKNGNSYAGSWKAGAQHGKYRLLGLRSIL